VQIPKWDFSFAQQVKQEIESDIMNNVTNDAFPIKPQRIVYDVRKSVEVKITFSKKQ